MPDLKRLGQDLKKVDRLLVDLTARRMALARLVEFEKRRHAEPMFRAEIEDARLAEIADYASEVGVNPHLARGMLYALINESCKQQTIQMQDPNSVDLEALSLADKQAVLRQNLLDLCAQVAPNYDEQFYNSNSASRLQLERETRWVARLAEQASDASLALDLGCATGRMAQILAPSFSEVVGYDLSPDMIDQAQKSAPKNTQFHCHDLETGIPQADNSVDAISMGFGAASDIYDLPALLSEIQRVLKPKGIAYLCFYNKEALNYRFGFLPWRSNTTSEVNIYTDCLEVKTQAGLVSIPAKTYSGSEVKSLLPKALSVQKLTSYPVVSAFLPPELMGDDQAALEDLDRSMANAGDRLDGAYLMALVQKS